MVKMLCFAKRRQGMSFEEFDRYWANDHAAFVKKIEPLLQCSKYVQVHADTAFNNAGPEMGWGRFENVFDGLAYLEYPDMATFHRVMNDPKAKEGFAMAREDEVRFLDVPGSIVWFGKEKVVIG